MWEERTEDGVDGEQWEWIMEGSEDRGHIAVGGQRMEDGGDRGQNEQRGRRGQRTDRKEDAWGV